MNYTRFCVLLILSCFSIASTAQQPVLGAPEFNSQVSGKQVQLLDVRTRDEYAKNHLANSMNADWQDKAEFNRRTQFLDKTAPVYVYCLSGGRSHAAAEALRSGGFSKVYELKGGLTGWRASNLPVDEAVGGKDLSIEEFQHIVGKEGTVLVDFGAPWCPPCRQMIPVVDALEKNEKDVRVVRLNADESATAMKALKIEALPTFIVFKNGSETWRKLGVVKMNELKKQVN